MKTPALLTIGFTGLLILIFTAGCNREIDADGGYYDEKTQTYKYVNARARTSLDASSRILSPRAGEIQSVSGTITRIDPDGKAVWLRLKDRKPYMILAAALSGGNREDKNKELRISLEYVSPSGSVVGNSNFRAQWSAYVVKRLTAELVNQSVLAEIKYLEGPRKFVGTLYKTVQTQEGRRTRNLNLWMIQQGLSYYFIDAGKAAQDDDFIKAQQIARQQKLGLWQYQ